MHHHFQYPPSQSLQPKLNEFPSQRKPNTSEYRTHFTLMNVYCPTTTNYEHYIIQMAQKLRKYINCEIIQISQIVNENRVDLTIGMQSDKEAIMFLLKNQEIKIQTDKYGQESYMPMVSDVFKIYMNSKKHLYTQFIAEQQKQEVLRKSLEDPNRNVSPKKIESKISLSPLQKQKMDPSRSHSSQSQSRSQSGSQNSRISINNYGQQQRRRQAHQRQRSRSREKGFALSGKSQSLQNKINPQIKQVLNVYQIWIFCIPLQCDERDVQTRLKQRKIYTQYNSSVWRMSEDMQYLQVRLQRPLSVEAVNNIDLKISNYPCIVMPKQRNQVQLRQQIKRYQSQLICQNPINENLLLECLAQVSGVVSVIKDDYFDQEKYIITFNMLSKVPKFEKKCKEIFGTQIQLSNPQDHVRMCRLEKMFSITHMINDYAQKMRRSV